MKSENSALLIFGEDPEPHPEPVDLSVLLDEIAAVILRYVIVSREQADTAALWVTHTYLIDYSDVSPIAIINAPERACAKTLFQTILGRMVRRPLYAANTTSAALFRAIEHWRPTLLLDEGDTFFRDRPDLHGLVNAGYAKGGFVLRAEGKGDNTFEPKAFAVYSAKSIAGIALERHLPDATMSRGIAFHMRRKLPGEVVERYRDAADCTFSTIRSKLERVALDSGQKIGEARPPLPPGLGDRAQDNWEPLLTIALLAGDDWLDRATKAAMALSSRGEVQAGHGNELLADIRAVFSDRLAQRITTKVLIEALAEDEEAPWGTYNRGRWITPRQLAKLLSVYDIGPKTIRQPNGTPKGYDRADFEDAFKRYLPPEPPDDRF